MATPSTSAVTVDPNQRYGACQAYLSYYASCNNGQGQVINRFASCSEAMQVLLKLQNNKSSAHNPIKEYRFLQKDKPACSSSLPTTATDAAGVLELYRRFGTCMQNAHGNSKQKF